MYIGTVVGKSTFTIIRMEKYKQVMIIAIALLTQKNVPMAQCTYVQYRKCHKLPALVIYAYNTRINSVFRLLTTVHLHLPTPVCMCVMYICNLCIYIYIYLFILI